METPIESGSLDATPLPALLLALYRRRASGRLELEREGLVKRIWLRDGMPVLAESNLPSESLGIQLLDAGRITREDYARLVELVRSRGGKEGAALLALGLVGPQDLFTALKEQVRRRLLDCLGWPRGRFAFDPADAPAADAAAFRCDPVPLVQEGVAIHWSAQHLRGALAAQLDRYPEPGPRFAALSARLHRDPDVERLLAGLDGKRTLGAVLADATGPAALAAAWVLDALGAAAWHDQPLADSGETAAEGCDPAPDEPAFEIVVGIAGGPEPAAAGGHARREQASGAQAGRAAPSTPAAAALREEILERHGALAERDHYQLLGLAHDADLAQIKRAYFGAAKRFHPDALGALGLADLRPQAEQLFGRIAEAYEVLSDPARRREYDEELTGDGSSDVSRVVQAEALYRKAEVMLRAGNFQGAVDFLRPAVALWPEECAYQSALGWALHKKRPSDPAAARTHLEQAVALDDRDAVAHFRLAVVLRALGEHAAAERELAVARRLDPKVR